jgi:putative ABC transport system permease protein
MLNDLRYALRMLIKSPGFTFIAILTLALGIGANSAIFSVIDGVLLRSLPFPQADRLTMIWATAPQHPGEDHQVHSYPDYVDLRGQNHTFSAISAFTSASVIWGMGTDSEDVPGLAATSDIFDVLQTQPFLGRGFSRDDEKPGAARVVVISYDFWQRRFAGASSILGKKVMLANHVHIITGVMPLGWKFPVHREAVNFVTPLVPLYSGSDDAITRRGSHFLFVAGRLKPGVDLRTASTDVQTIAAQLAKQYPETDAGRTERVVDLRSDVVSGVRPALLVLLAAVSFVLLIACANVANLFLARAATREREIAIRSALGATRSHIVRQLLAETLLLALLGGAAGLLFAWWSTDALIAFGPADLPRLDEIRVNGAVVAFTFGVAVVTSIVFGLVPALHASRPDVERSLKEGGRGTSAGLHSHRLRSTFVVAQIALSLVLLVGAGLLIRSFSELSSVRPGFDANGAVTFWQALPKARYGEIDQQIQFFDRLVSKLAALPGIEAAGMASPLPFGGDDRGSTFTVAGRPAPAPGMEPSASRLTTDGRYFATMHIPLKAGRSFEARDTKDSKPVVMINDAFAREFFPNENPLGQHVTVGGSTEHPQPAREVVGVVGAVKHVSLSEMERPEVYLLFPQDPDRYMDLVVRTRNANLSGVETMIRHAVHEIDSQQFVPVVRPLSQLVSQTLAESRFHSGLLGVFAAVAIILAAVGIYGVIAYNVAQRTKEIGIRMALGAQQGQMLTMILRQSLTMAGIGIGVGLFGALGATRLLGALLFGVGTTDLLTYAAVVLLLGAAALLAGLLPARRAMKVDPVIALRYE